MDALLFICSLLTVNPIVVAYFSGQLHWFILAAIISPDVVTLWLLFTNEQVWGVSWLILAVVFAIISWRAVEGTICRLIHFLTRSTPSVFPGY